MEKIQIAKYGMMQVTAVVYAILACGAAVKFNRPLAEAGYAMSDAYRWAAFFREYGIWLLVAVMFWAVAVSYLGSPLSKWDFQDEHLSYSGLALTIIYAILGSYLAIGAFTSPGPSLLK